MIFRCIIFVGIISTASFVTSCSSKVKVEGPAEKDYTITVDPPVAFNTPVYKWEITEKPLLSNLTLEQFVLEENGQIATFQPDVRGEYRFRLEILDTYTNKTAEEKYVFLISEPDRTEGVKRQTEEVQDSIESVKSVPTADSLLKGIPPIPPIKIVDQTVTPASIIENIPPKITENKPTEGSAIGIQQPVKRKPRANRFYSIQLAAKENLSEAEELSNQLGQSGFDSYIIQATVHNKTWYRVRVGNFERQSEAYAAAGDIGSLLKTETWVCEVE